MKYFYCFLFICLIDISLYANCITVGDGDWWTASTWSCSPESAPPGCADTIEIRAVDSIYIDAQVDLIYCGPIVIVVYGIIQFETGTRMKLASGSEVIIKSGGKIIPGGGDGSANYLEIGGNIVWTDGDGPQSGPLTYTETGPLPIKLISFEANVNGNRIDIKWITASEINNDYFTIERSTDAQHWEAIITTKGAGNSNQTLTYFETDFYPLTGISYYRLKQTDFDGNYEYFNIVPVKFIPDVETEISLYPNPVKQGDTISISGIETNKEVLIVIRDIQDKEFYSKTYIEIENNELIGISIDTAIPQGIYIIVATSENSIYSKKIRGLYQKMD